MSKLYFDDPDCDYKSPFALLGETEKHVRHVDSMIETALHNCVKRLLEIAKKHPIGIGDTATDEEIMSRFYQKLHYESAFEPSKYK